jgi:hypothetical protein
VVAAARRFLGLPKSKREHKDENLLSVARERARGQKF